MPQQQPLNVLTVHIAPRHCLVNNQVIDLRHRHMQAVAKVDGARPVNGVLFESKPCQAHVKFDRALAVPQKEHLGLERHLLDVRSARHDLVMPAGREKPVDVKAGGEHSRIHRTLTASHAFDNARIAARKRSSQVIDVCPGCAHEGAPTHPATPAHPVRERHQAHRRPVETGWQGPSGHRPRRTTQQP